MSKDIDFNKYRKRIVSRLPIFTQAVFSFRNKSYYGHGLHYDLEKRLGKVITMAQDIDFLYHPDSFINRMIFKITVSSLARDITRIKFELGEI